MATKHKLLGNTGLVSDLCLGSTTFGNGENIYRLIGAVDEASSEVARRSAGLSG